MRVRTSAPRTAILRYDGKVLHVDLAAPPVDNRANVALIRLLASGLGIAKGRIQIAFGHRSKEKLLDIDAPRDTVQEWLDRQKTRPLRVPSE